MYKYKPNWGDELKSFIIKSIKNFSLKYIILHPLKPMKYWELKT